MKVANVVLNNFTNDSRVLKISNTLGKVNFAVTVLAMHDENLPYLESSENFNVERIKLLTRKWPKIKFFQVFKYLEFIIRAFLKAKDNDFIHCNDLSALPVGVLAKVFNKNVKVIYDAHEYETEMNGVHGLEKRIIKIMEKGLIKFADEVMTVSDSISCEYSKLYAIEKPKLVLNCPYYAVVEKHDIFREQLGIRKEQKIFLYQGALSRGRGIDILLNTFVKLDDDSKVLVVMGYGKLESVVKDFAEKSERIFFFPAVSPTNLLIHTSSADYGISFIEDSCLSYRYCLPNKMFEYFMAGLPVIVSNLYEMSSLVRKYNVGVVSEENTEVGFINAINKIVKEDYSKMKYNVSTISKLYSWENQELEVLKVYN
ncbi:MULTISPECIES: glycosyltransferase family 4 protein [unclassified Pseudoalteromonas]|uniref:glycosyltransferase family 4 protein n=1 Tax=unclassified Pseudoalteromonas TaxID=194690 RepID=UPI00110B49C2|nr:MULTISPECIES: glycosyltransferase family 4 protein [unclassified Pseudoalteromonas]TMP49543.1 glycosyl transferase family 1 [Pseudoalteromonas sp. S1650]TMP64429.1 glycosyl transferase family 1 [Pseudoalteromonas sp. S1649]